MMRGDDDLYLLLKQCASPDLCRRERLLETVEVRAWERTRADARQAVEGSSTDPRRAVTDQSRGSVLGALRTCGRAPALCPPGGL